MTVSSNASRLICAEPASSETLSSSTRIKSMDRKLTAIFCADVFGYSRLTGENEEATHRTLTAYRKIVDALIEQHRGRFVHSAGDSVLAEFPFVVNAVQCAVAIQTTLKDKQPVALSTKLEALRILGVTVRTDLAERVPASPAELHPCGIVKPAIGTPHRPTPQRESDWPFLCHNLDRKLRCSPRASSHFAQKLANGPVVSSAFRLIHLTSRPPCVQLHQKRSHSERGNPPSTDGKRGEAR
jgi:hypothetical protein